TDAAIKAAGGLKQYNAAVRDGSQASLGAIGVYRTITTQKSDLADQDVRSAEAARSGPVSACGRSRRPRDRRRLWSSRRRGTERVLRRRSATSARWPRRRRSSTRRPTRSARTQWRSARTPG